MTFKGYNKEYSVQEIFHVESGKRVTEQQVYQHLGKVPVVTSKSLGEGISWYADEEWLKRKGKIYEHPLITWTKEGYAGKFFFRNYKFFPIDVCGVLVLRDEFKDKVNMNWFIFTQQENFYKNVYSKGSQGKLYQESAKKIKLILLDKNTQDKIAKKYLKLQNIYEKVNKILVSINNDLKKTFSFEKGEVDSFPAEKIFKKISGNSGLTEEYIYSLIQNKERDIKFSGGSINDKFINIPFCNHPKKSGSKIHILDNEEGIFVVRKGKAGTIKYLKKGRYATNDDAYILSLKKEYKTKINLKWIYYTHKKLFLEYSSSSDNGTWNMTNFMKEAQILIPSLKEQNKIIKLYEALNEKKNKIIKLKRQIKEVFEKEIKISL